jgi:hypothetical protein
MGNLDDSIKTPFIRVYNFEDKLVASSNFNHVGEESPGIDVVSIKYCYDDDDDDECLIRLQANDVDWIDYIGFDREDILTVSWGYIGGPEVSKRTVVIRDIKSNYGINALYTDIKCTDMATYLKLSMSEYTLKASPMDYIKEYCAGTLNINLISSGKTLYKQGAFEKLGQFRNEVKISEFTSQDDTIIPLKPTRPDPLLRDVLIYSEEVQVGDWSVGKNNPVRKYMEKERDINVMNKSPFTVISELMELCPYGPWFVTGRDNNITIHNRDLGSNSYAVYAYRAEPGYLISFQPETKYEAFSKNTISQIGNNPVTKSALFLDSYISILDNLRSSKDIITDRGISDSDKVKELTKWLSVYKGGYQKYKTIKQGFRITASGTTFPVNSFNEKYYEDKSVAKKDVLDLANPIIRGNTNPNNYIDPLSTIVFGYQFVTPITDLSETSTLAENAARKLEMEKEEANILVEGDPLLKNNITITISKVQVQHVGNYYIKKCEHTISNMGYKVSMEGFKVMDSAVIDIYTSDKIYQSNNQTTSSVILGKNTERWRSLVEKYFPITEVENALRIIQLESAGDPTAFRPEELNPGGGNDSGLFQINSKWHPESYIDVDIFDAETNIKAAAKIWKDKGWEEWSTYEKAIVTPVQTNKPEERVLKHEDKYRKEERIFRKWDIIPVITSTITTPLSSLQGQGRTTKQTNNIDIQLDEYFRRYPDTNAQDLVNLYNQGKLKFTEVNTENR